MRLVRRFVPFAALALAVAFAPSVRAEDAAPDVGTQIKALLTELDTHEKAKDGQAIVTATKKAGPLFKATQDAALRMSLAKGLAGIVKNAKLDANARRAALGAISDTEDGALGWKALSSAYPANDSD